MRNLPVVVKRQSCHVPKSFEGFGSDAADVVARYEEVSSVARDATRDVLELFRYAFHRQGCLGALAAGWARRASMAEGTEHTRQNNP